MEQEIIPRDQWPKFLEAYARQHQGWLANVEVCDPEDGCVVLLQDRPLKEIVDSLEQEKIAIVFGEVDGEQEAKVIEGPARILSLEGTGNADIGLEIETQSGHTIALRFRSPMPPEMVDGIAA